jgi:PAS domain S-box-containing protein
MFFRKSSRRISLRRLIVSPIIFLVLMSSFLAAYFSIHNGTKAVNSVSNALRSEVAISITARMQSFFSVSQTICRINGSLISRGILNPAEPLEMEQWFQTLVHIYPQVSSIYFGNVEGGLVNAGREATDSLFYVITTEGNRAGTFRKLRVDSSGTRTAEILAEIPDFDARVRSWYLAAVEARGAIARTEPFRIFTGEDISISTSRTVVNQQGELLGVVSCDMCLSHLSNYLNTMQIGVSGFAVVTDFSGRILARSTDTEPSGLGELVPMADCEDDLIRALGLHLNSQYGSISSIQSVSESCYAYNGSIFHVLVSPFSDDSGKMYYIAVIIPESDYLSFVQSNNKDTAILLLLSLILSIIVGLFVANRISKPILELHSAVKNFSEGAEKEISPHRITEVNELSLAFNQQTRRLKASMNELKEEIDERKATENALKESEERMDLAIRGTGAATWDWDLKTGVIIVNQRYAEMLGYSLDEIEPVTETVWRSLSDPSDMVNTDVILQEHFKGLSELYESTFRMRHKEGNWIWVIDRGMVLEWDSERKPSRMAGTHVDITRSKNAEINQQRLQNQVNKTRELESIGQLAGGVAHDLNNLLTPVIGYTEILLEDPGTLSNSKMLLEILRAGRSAQQLVNQLLAFGRKQHFQLDVFDLNEMVKNYLSLLRRTIRENITITIDYYDTVLPVEGDSSKLEQVLMNLAVNAQDAMQGGGRMQIQTSLAKFPVDASDNELHGSYAVLAVSDNGSGMDSETMEKIYEPFFTTKGERGTGLGLSTSYGIISQHHGIIDVKSEVGNGSTFRIFLPISSGNLQHAAVKAELQIKAQKKTILIVEDNNEVREVARIALERLGYTVFVANCGDEALVILRSRGNAVDLMLTDVIMPGISLEELHSEALTLLPFLKVIYMSGYSGDYIRGEEQSRKSVPFISKPFSLADLAGIVESVLREESN